MRNLSVEIPEDVVAVLSEVRESGAVNMLDRQGVLKRISDLNTAESARTFLWLIGDEGIQARAAPTQRRRYLTALKAIGG